MPRLTQSRAIKTISGWWSRMHFVRIPDEYKTNKVSQGNLSWKMPSKEPNKRRDPSLTAQSPFNSNFSAASAAISLAAGMLGIGLVMPFWSTPVASSKTYEPAFWQYDHNTSHFDNSPWSYGTDYVIAVGMVAYSTATLSLSQRGNTDRLCIRVAFLASMCMMSVATGGICHQFYTTVESRNSISFRILWTLCVGAIPLGNTWMGCCASEILRRFQPERICCTAFQNLPIVPESFWYIYGLCAFFFTAWGGMSHQRPACDLFVAAVTQAPPSYYMMAILFFLDRPKSNFNARIWGAVGLNFHIPLLPLYPMLVQYTDWSLGAINTLLHSWLAVSWAMQAYSLYRIIQSVMI